MRWAACRLQVQIPETNEFPQIPQAPEIFEVDYDLVNEQWIGLISEINCDLVGVQWIGIQASVHLKLMSRNGVSVQIFCNDTPFVHTCPNCHSNTDTSILCAKSEMQHFRLRQKACVL